MSKLQKLQSCSFFIMISILTWHTAKTENKYSRNETQLTTVPNPGNYISTPATGVLDRDNGSQHEEITLPNLRQPEIDIAGSNFSTSPCTEGNSADLNHCLRQILKIIKPHLSGGISQLNIPPMDPLEIQNVVFQQGTEAVRITSEFTNVKIKGISNFLLADLRTDVPGRTLSFDMIFPQLSLTGSYELSGNIFLFLISGKGDFYFDLNGALARGTSVLGVSRNNSHTQVNVKKMDINLTIENIKVHLTNLFNGEPVLGAFINKFLNENSQEVFEEVRPQIEIQVGEILSLLANRTLSLISTSYFFNNPIFQEFIMDNVEK